MKRLPLYPLKKIAGLWLFVLMVFIQSVCAQISPSTGNILFVNHHVLGGTGSGNSWGNAIRELADALKWANDNKHSGIWDARKPLQIWVAEGIYRPQYSPETGLPPNLADPKDRAFLMVENVAIYGGFPSAGNPVMTDRNWDEHVTLLDGDNAYHVVVAVNSVSMETRLDGVCITGGRANGDPADPLTVNGISVTKADGGGIYSHNSYVDFFNLNIYANSASRSGGGIYIHAGTIELINVLVSNNIATEGGGIKVSDSFSQFTNVTISRNTADHGGGIHATGEPGSICENSIIYGNNAPDAANVYTTWINGNRLSFDYSLIGEPSGSTTSDDPDYNGNITTTVNPFADMEHDNFALGFRSIAIDKGKNSEYDVTKSGDKDLAGKPRIYGMAIDMGAYERQPSVLDYTPGAGNILYVNERVDQVAPGYIQDGSSWANAVPELADALKWAAINKAEWAGQPLKLYVAEGTYKPLYSPEDGAGFAGDGRNNAFLLIEDVQLYGGFSATGNPTLNDRDWVANETILDGDNSYHVVVSAGEAGTARLDGFTIIGGNANGESSHFITINGRGVAPVSGGGIAISGASPGLLNLNIHNNRSGNSGGGVYNESGAPRMINTVVSDNRSNHGGGVYTFAGSPSLTNVVISNNTADEHGGGMVSGTYASATLTNVTIVGNTAGSDGGGIYNDLSSFVSTAPTTAFYNCLFFGNIASHSGNDLYNRRNIGDDSGTPLFTNSLVGGSATWQAAWGTNVGGSSMATTVNPFMDMAGSDYTLSYDSDAVDGGSNEAYDEDEYGGKDLAGNPRTYKGTIDIGAYEFQGVPIAPTDNILYVKKGSMGSQSGDSWGNAIAELADALKWARERHDAGNGWDHDDPLQIWVAAGTYQPNYHAADGKYGTDGGRHNSFVLVPNVRLYGGFDPDNGTDDLTDERLLPDVSSGEAGGTILAGDNAYHVVISAKPVGEARLDGFTITEGNAEGSASIGVYTESINPVRGGGMYIADSSPTLANVSIRGNAAYDSGGGLYLIDASPKLVNVVISGNVVTGANSYGGGMDNNASSPTLDRVRISDNSSNNDGGGLSNRNGSSPVLTHVYITGNSAGIDETSVSYGGGIYNQSSSPALANVEIHDNTAAFGGGLANRSSAARLRNVVICGNRSRGAGGGVYNDAAAAALTLTNVTISGNIAMVNASAGEWFNNSGTPIIRNSIIYGNGIRKGIAGNLTNSQYSLLQEHTNAENGNLNYTGSVEDLFVSPADGDYRLLACSPTVDSGHNTFYEDADGDLERDNDLAGGPRVVGDVIDMGAYELQGEKIDYDQIAFTAAEVMYNGTAHTITATNLPTGISVSYELFNAEDEEITEAIHVGTYTVKATFSGCGTLRQLSATLTILPKELIITAKDRSKTYGEAVAVDGTAFMVDGLENDDEVTSVTLISDGVAATAAVGDYDIVAADAQGTRLDNYAIEYEEGTLTVETKALTIIANDRSKTYGETVAFDGMAFTVDGLENDDEVTSVTLTSEGATATTAVGDYDIVAADAQGMGLDNYAIEYEEGTLTVDTKALTIIANDRSKTYGETVAFDGTAFTVDGLENDDEVTSVTLTSEGATATTAVGDYDIMAADAQGTGLTNYDVEYVVGMLTVGRKVLIVTADNWSKTYGDAVAFDDAEFTAEGLENDDAVTSVTLTSAGAAATAVVGDYDIEASDAQGLGLTNYDIEYTKGTLIVRKKFLTITANNQRKTYGQTIAFTGTEFTTSGLENDDEITSVVLISEGVFASAIVGNYGIEISTAHGTGLDNYTIDYKFGALTVDKRSLTVTVVGGQRKVFGQTDPELTYTFTPGLVADDFFTGELTRDSGEQVGEYKITQGNLSAGTNYEIAFVPDIFTITLATITGVRLEDGSFVYDGMAKLLEIEGTPPKGAVVTYIIEEKDGNRAVDVGMYKVIATISCSNYETLKLAAELEITPLNITVSVDSKAKVFGTDDPTLTYTVSPRLVGGDAFSGSLSREPGEDAGEYAIIQSGLWAGSNYSITFESDTLTITPAAITGITLPNRSFVYNGGAKSLNVNGTLPEGAAVRYINNSRADVGMQKVTAVVSGANYQDLVLTADLIVIPAIIPNISLLSAKHIYDGEAQILEVGGELPGGAEISYTINGEPGNSAKDAGIYRVEAIITGHNYQMQELAATLTIFPATRSIAFPSLSNKTYGDGDFAAGAVASSGEDVRYTSSNPAVAEIRPTGSIRITGAGEATITAMLPQNSNYTNRSAVSRVLTVDRASQTIVLSVPSEVYRNVGTVAITASSSSNLPVTLHIDDPNVATLESQTLHIHRLGTVRITATQQGNGNYEAAEAVTTTVRVVDPESDFPVRVNKAISPNGDGINEYLIIEAIKDYPKNRVTIFNRNGTIVWEANGYDNDRVAFRGIGTGQYNVPARTFFYLAEIKVDGKWKYEKGWFVLRY
ncbi:MBG domain-containing protein [Parapedobacter indicus]|uniref:Gliding motility-associated C-terminal domain-containing protein n=1 Tax=Parapedobacter indicus TaxID=1477437 RepID=A0A1I3S461_9SPHI|nr:MBG domain-containing protein [Parapedobacter indicus]PPK99901.1 gliding motility-associated-like protein [Parapedobacter indicus]SFJ52387.1 gliding motility-associated C-terminal domain-containing protein [Parapedobacter indicus]